MGDEECSFQLFIKKLDIEDSVIFYREPKHTDEVHYKSILNHEDNWYLDVGISWSMDALCYSSINTWDIIGTAC